jgi:hypothetical protein
MSQETGWAEYDFVRERINCLERFSGCKDGEKFISSFQPTSKSRSPADFFF